MNSYPLCANCSSPIPPDAPSGMCPKCLLQAGLSDSAVDLAAMATDGATSVTETIGLKGEDERTGIEWEDHSSSGFPGVGTKIRYIGDYELLHEIARGGMGVVYKARQVRLNRIVALKMILSGQFASSVEVRRFYTEAEAAAQLDHSGIVPVFEVGQHNKHHYYSMGFVDGESLAKRIAVGPLAPRVAAEILLRVAEAIEYAHRRGVIHRDLKPANVLLDKAGQPKVTDFGLAKRIQGTSHLTASGQILGTPSYMPPEQVAGRADQVNETADIYSLGAMLYSMLTGRPPFHADNPLDTMMQVIERDPVSPRALNPAVPLDLETICLKCLEKDRRQRYGSAGDLAQELRRYLEGKPILARPVGRFDRAWRWCRRNPLVASLLVAVALSLVGGTIVSMMFAVEARHRAEGERKNREAADQQTRLTEAQLNRSEWFLYTNEIASAQREGELNNPSLATSILDRTSQERRSWEYHFLRRQNEQSLRLSIKGHDQKVLALAVSPDGELLASAGRDRSVRIWDSAKGREIVTLASDLFVTHLTFSPDGGRVAGVDTEGKLRIWDPRTGQRQSEIVTSPIAGLAASRAYFIAGSDLVVTHNKDGSIAVWDPLNGSAHRSIPIPLAAVTIAVSPDGNWLAAGSLTSGHQSEIQVWSFDASSDASKRMSIAGRLAALAFDHTSKRMAIGVFDPSNASTGVVRVVDVSRMGEEGDPNLCQIPIRARQVGFTADDQFVFAIGMDGLLTKCDASSGAIVRQFQSRSPSDQALEVTPDAALLINGNDAGVLELWNTSTHSLPTEFPLNEWGYSVAFSRDGRRVVGGSSKIVTIWDASTGDKVIEIPAHNGTVHTVAFHPESDKVLSGSWDGSLKLWEVPSGKELFRIGGGTREYDSFSISPNGDLFATGTGFTAEIRLHDAHTGDRVETLTGVTERVGVTAFSADGAWLVSGGEIGEVAVWDVSRRAMRWTTRLGQDRIRFVTINADSKWFAALSQTGAIAVWEIETGQQKFSLEEPGAYCLRFTPDSRRLVSGGADAALKFWTVDTGQKVCTIAGHNGRIFSMAFSPDGRRLATTGDAGAVFLRDAGQPLPSLISSPLTQP